MNDGRLIGFIPFVFVVVGVVVCFVSHMFGDMRHTSVDNDHCARIRFNYVNLLFLCVMFDLCVDVRFRFGMSRLNEIICIFVLGLVCGEVRHMSNLIARWRPKTEWSL